MSWDFSHDGANQQFGRRPRNGGEWHYGRDYGTRGKKDVPLGVPKYCDGWICHVIENNKIDGLGNQVVLISPDGKEMVRFGHIATGSMKHLRTGQIVNHGDWIGNIGGVGYTENSFQPHIHVEHGINPRYELVQTKHNGKYYQHYTWFCGEHTIEDYRDPQAGALPFEELEELTNMAFQSRELILSGRGNSPRMSSSMPVDIVKQENSFIEWFRSSWIGSLFFSDNEQEEPQNESEPRTGPIIHRKTPVQTEAQTTPVSHTRQTNASARLAECSEQQDVYKEDDMARRYSNLRNSRY